jgi:superfamily II DNA helicase RecQ
MEKTLMRFQFFTIPAKWPEESQKLLNAFCAQHRLMTVEKHFVVMGTESYWSLCVTYIEGSAQTIAQLAGNRRDRVDYKEVLGEQDFAVYAQLRDLRKSLSEQEGVPAYALFTNEQLAEMVTRKVRSETELAQIEGVGKARLEKYGKIFLQLLKAATTTQTENRDAPPTN